MGTKRHIQQINAILGKLTEEFNKNRNKKARERLKKEQRSFTIKVHINN